MNSKPLFLLLLTLFSLNKMTMSQTKPEHTISGTIVDSLTNKPLDYITVSLKSDKNIAIKAALSKANGSFTFSGIKPSKYLLSIVGVGFKAKTLPVDLTDSTSTKRDVGTIYLTKASNKLKEVVITGDKPIVTQEIDRISYNLQADPDSKGSNVLEMMRKVPLLSIDAEDNILLRGDKNYKILINGKPSSMVERNPKDILRSMPASSIEKIEVITTPPSKYDAEGLSGIINIITNKKVDNGYNGSLNLNERFPVGGPGIGGSFTIKQGKFGTSGFGGGSFNNSPSTVSTNNRSTDITALTQNGSRKSDSRSGYFGGEVSYEIDSLKLISGQFNINGNRNDGNSNQQSFLRNNTEVIESYNFANDNTGRGSGLDLALNYQLGFKSNKNRLLTLSYRFFTFNNDLFNNLAVTDWVSHDDPGYKLVDYKQVNEGNSSEQTFQIDYAHPVKKLTIETGVKGILRNNKSDFSYHLLNANGLFEKDAQRSNNFKNEQRILAVYNSYQYSLKDWGFKGGLRLEHTVIDADFISSSSELKKEYLNLVPSVSISKKLKNMSNLTLGFSSKIKRPGISQLNPFVDRSNPNFETSGNPELRPSTQSGVELRYSKFKKGSINAGLFYGLFNKMVMPVAVLNTTTNITRSTFENTLKARLIGANINVNYPVTKKLNVTVNAFAGYGKVKGSLNEIPFKNDGVMYNAYGSVAYRFEKGWRTSANINFNGPDLSLQGTTNTYIGSSFGVTKDVVKDKLSFSATANNPFAKYRYLIRETNGDNFYQESNNQSYFRTFSTSLNYRFGKLKSNVKKSKKGIINDDSGGGMGTPQ